MNDTQRQQLIAVALDAQQRAYCKYSNFPVGAAILTKGAQVFQGVNIENASFGLTICAERVAMASAISAGEKEFSAIAIASRGGAMPCGACRQFLAEFSPDLVVVTVDSRDPRKVCDTKLGLLLPNRFDGPT